ncbi:MAG TPA: alpha/beta fold hydrolase, partial [Streptosporangiaceae bacterium]
EFLAQCQSHTVRSGGQPYKYYQRGSGPAVLLVHGLHSNLGSMIPIAQALLADGYRVVLFDVPAHGEALGTMTNPLEVRDLIRAVAGQVGELHAVVAHSLGGLWALSSWAGDVRAATFVSISTPSNHRFLVDKFAQLHSLDDGTVQPLLGEIEKLLGEGVWTEYSPVDIVPGIGVPGLILHGSGDTFVPPEHAAELHAAWPGSTLELIDGAGHLDIAGSPQALALITGYLREASGG